MADERVRFAVKITDPTTDANEAAVSATGAVLVDVEELPAAAALSDATANPTTTTIGSMLMGFDGTDWERIYSVADGDAVAAGTTGFLVFGTDGSNYQALSVDAAGQLQVDVLTGGGGPTDTDDDIVAGGQSANLGIALNYGYDGTQWERLTTDTLGSLDVNVTLALPTGGNVIGDIGNLATIGTSVTPGAGALLLGKAEDVASASADVGVAAMVVRDDALTAGALVDADGDYTILRVNNDGALWVEDVGIAAALAGTELQVDVVAPLPTGTNEIGDIGSINTNVVPGVAATSLGKAESATHTSGDTGVQLLAVRDDTPVGLAADGEYIPLTTDSVGRLHVTDPNAGAGTPTNPTIETPALASIAAGATSTGTELRTSDLGDATQSQLSGIDITSSVPFKATIISEIDDAETIRVRALFGRAGETLQWRPPNKAYFAQNFAANAGFDGWRVEVTNLDNSQTTDFYVTFYYED